jgi:hypothetical protein
LEVGRREAEVAGEVAEAQRAQLLNQIVQDHDLERAGLLEKLLIAVRVPASGSETGTPSTT